MVIRLFHFPFLSFLHRLSMPPPSLPLKAYCRRSKWGVIVGHSCQRKKSGRQISRELNNISSPIISIILVKFFLWIIAFSAKTCSVHYGQGGDILNRGGSAWAGERTRPLDQYALLGSGDRRGSQQTAALAAAGTGGVIGGKKALLVSLLGEIMASFEYVVQFGGHETLL